MNNLAAGPTAAPHRFGFQLHGTSTSSSASYATSALAVALMVLAAGAVAPNDLKNVRDRSGNQRDRAYSTTHVSATSGTVSNVYRAGDLSGFSFEKTLTDFYASLVAVQEPMGPELVNVFATHLWELYEE